MAERRTGTDGPDGGRHTHTHGAAHTAKSPAEAEIITWCHIFAPERPAAAASLASATGFGLVGRAQAFGSLYACSPHRSELVPCSQRENLPGFFVVVWFPS